MKFKSREFKGLWRELEKVYFNIEPVMQNVIQNNERFIVDMNAQQMYAGEKATGKPIKPPYAPATIRYKQKKGQPTNRVTLRDTGDFHFKHLKVIARYNDFVIDTSLSGNRPYGFLMQGPRSYGEDILGLQDKNMRKLYDQKLKKPIENLFKKLIK